MLVAALRASGDLDRALDEACAAAQQSGHEGWERRGDDRLEHPKSGGVLDWITVQQVNDREYQLSSGELLLLDEQTIRLSVGTGDDDPQV